MVLNANARSQSPRFYTAVSVVAVAVVLLLWQLSTAAGWVNQVFLPSPASVWSAFIDLVRSGYKGQTLLGHISVSMIRLGIAVGLIVLVGVPLGIAAGASKTFYAVISPFIEFYRAIPPLAYYTLIVLWLGIGESSKDVLLFLSGFAPFFIAVVFAVQNVDQVRINAARSLGAGSWRVFTTVVLRACLPDILTALRAAVGITYATLVAAEMVAATSGLGWLVLDASKYLRNDVVYAGVILMGIIAIALNEFIQLLIRLVTPWRDHGRRAVLAAAAAVIAAVLAGVVIVGALPSAPAGQERAVAAGAPKEIRIGYFQSPNGELLAKGEGLLEKAFPGTKITYVEFDNGRDVNTAMAGGSLDLATIGTPPGTTGVINKLPYKIYYLHDIIGTSEALVARRGSGITDVADLRGKRVATAFGSTSHFSLVSALHEAGLSENDLTLLDMSAPDIVAAWGRGELDAAYIWQPAQEKLVSAGGQVVVTSKQLASEGAITGEFGIVSNDFLARYPDAVKTYIDVLDRAVRQYRAASPETVKVMARELGLSEDAARTTMGQIDVLDKSQQAAYIRDGKLADVLKKTGDFLLAQKSVTVSPDKETLAGALAKGLYE